MRTTILVLFLLLSGEAALTQNTNAGTGAGNSGSANTSIGYYAGDVVTGTSNTFLGYYSGKLLPSGNFNTFLGAYSGYSSNSNVQYNLFVGYRSGYTNSDGGHNTFLGSNAGERNSIGSYNTFIGKSAGINYQTGSNNTFVGYYSGIGLSNSSGMYNVAVGSHSGEKVGGNENIFIGYYSGFSNASGSGNVFIGNKAGYVESGSNKLYIDNTATSTPLVYGDFASNQLGINALPNSSHTLTVGGTIHATGIYVNGQSITDSGFEFWTKAGGNIWNNSGNVGIGTNLTSNPHNYRLAVNGKLGAHEVQIENNSSTWPDFVFDGEYKLLTLNELEMYIKANRHLPDIPTANEVKEQGILLGEMNAKLLQKIEELTLYVIELKKELDELKGR